MTWQQYPVLFVAAAFAGAVNSVAGGGTLLTFPALLWSGHSAIVANATSTVALWPGQLGSLWGYRREVGANKRAILILAVPSFLGGTAGAVLLLHTPSSVFDRLVPWLILAATLMFVIQEPLARRQRRAAEAAGAPGVESSALSSAQNKSAAAWVGVIAFQTAVAIYGGYFGAGIGIMMLAALGMLGFRNIHQMNGMKNVNGLCINAVAASLFIANRLVDWRIAALMAFGSVVGGYSGAGIARKIGQKNVRRVIIGIGCALSVYLALRSR